MSLNIKNEEAHRMAKEMAEATGESMTKAVTEAIRERRDRVMGLSKQERYERIMAASRRTAPLLKDVETDPAKLLYGDDGLPK